MKEEYWKKLAADIMETVEKDLEKRAPNPTEKLKAALDEKVSPERMAADVMKDFFYHSDQMIQAYYAAILSSMAYRHAKISKIVKMASFIFKPELIDKHKERMNEALNNLVLRIEADWNASAKAGVSVMDKMRRKNGK